MVLVSHSLPSKNPPSPNPTPPFSGKFSARKINPQTPPYEADTQPPDEYPDLQGHPSIPPSSSQPPDSTQFPPLPSTQNHQPKIPKSNPWTKPSTDSSLPNRKFFLRFIPPSNRGSKVVGVCSSTAVAGELQVLDNTLVGFFLGKKPGFTLVRGNLLKQWKTQGPVEVLQLIHGGFAFRFSSLEDRDRILEAGIYHVAGLPFFLRPWERNLHTGEMMGLKRVPLWINLPGLPLHLWGEESLSAVCSVLGQPLFSDSTTATKRRWAYARACVEFHGDKPMLDSITIEDDEGNEFQQQVVYDWKPPQCLSCGVFGHAQDSCKANSVSVLIEKTVEKDSSEVLPKSFSKVETRKTFASLLQHRTSKLLGVWNPIRVRKTSPLGLDPTRLNRNKKPHSENAVMEQNSGLISDHVLGIEEMPCGPNTGSGKADEESSFSPSPPFSGNAFQISTPAPFDPSTSNRFLCLEDEVDSTPNDQTQDPSFSPCPISLPLGGVSPLLVDHSQPLGPGSTLNRFRRGRSRPVLGGPDPVQTAHTHVLPKSGITPPNLSLGLSTPAPHNTSAGRTPYPSRYSIHTHPIRSDMNFDEGPGAIADDVEDVDIEEEDKINHDDDEDIAEKADVHQESEDEEEDVIKRKKPAEFDDDEDVDEEDAGIEEVVDEDSEEKKENQLGREDAVEETSKRKKFSNYGRDNEIWVTTTELNDPRRINIC